MKLLSLVGIFACSLMGQSVAARTVYVMPMAGGLDQYLAEQIAQGHVMQVVADPMLADTVLTDKLGTAFVQKLAAIHPRDEDPDENEAPKHDFATRGTRGTIFLVDTKSRVVIWSDYEKPAKSSTGAELNKEAGRIVKKLQAGLK